LMNVFNEGKRLTATEHSWFAWLTFTVVQPLGKLTGPVKP